MHGSIEYYGGNEDALVFKTDSLGYLLWAKAYGGASADGFARRQRPGMVTSCSSARRRACRER